MANVFTLIDGTYRKVADGTLRIYGRPPLGTVVAPPSHGHAEISGISGYSMDPAVIPPDPPPGNRNATVGALPPGMQTYPVPTTGTVVYVDDSASAGGNGSITAPFKTIQTASNNCPAGGTIVMRAGVYNEGGAPGAIGGAIGMSKDNMTLMAYPGEVVWLDGSVPWTGWVTDTTAKPGTTLYRAPYNLSFDRSVQFARGSADGTQVGYIWIDSTSSIGRAANIYDQVFLISSTGQETALRPVATLAEVVPGRFYVAGAIRGGTGSDKMVWDATALYLADNPASYAQVRVSNKTTAITVAGSSGTDTTIGKNCKLLGFGVRKYAGGNSDGGTVQIRRSNNTVENLTILDSAAIGLDVYLNTRPGPTTIRAVTVQNAGLNGMHVNASNDLRVYDSVFEYANTHRWLQAPAAGGVKVTYGVNQTFKNCKFNNNYADGLWFDDSLFNVDVISCDAQNNSGHGMEYEISAKSRWIDCLATGNAKSGILIRCSDASEMWYCTSVNNAEVNLDVTQDNRGTANGPVAGVFGQDNRYSGKDDPVWGTIGMYWWIKNITVQNCLSTRPNTAASGGMLRIRTQTGVTRVIADFGPSVNGNLYSRPTSGSPAVGWVLITTGYNTFAAYKAAGTAGGVSFDPNGLNLDGHDVLNSDYSLKTADDTSANAVVPGMNATIAAILSKPVGTKHVGAFL